MQQFCELVLREGKTETPIMWKAAKAWLEYLSGKKEAALKVTEVLTENGVEAIWNFTNMELTEPNSPILVENVHFSDSLLALSYFVSERMDENAAKPAQE